MEMCSGIISLPRVEQVSHERSSSADHPPALLASSPDPSHIFAPPGSVPPTDESENTVITHDLT